MKQGTFYGGLRDYLDCPGEDLSPTSHEILSKKLLLIVCDELPDDVLERVVLDIQRLKAKIQARVRKTW